MSGRTPVFIAGCCRSGTTYLKTLIDAHPDVFIPSESLFLADYVRFGDCVPRTICRWFFFREPQLRAWYDGPEFRIDDIPAAIHQVHCYSAVAEGATRWGQKTPRFVRWIPEFTRVFPGCKWVLIYRDPRAVVASMLRSRTHTYSIRTACRRWCHDNAHVVDALRTFSSHILVIKYESLIEDFESTIERIQGFLGLQPVDVSSLVQSGKVREFVGSSFRVVGENLRSGLRPNPDPVDAWRSVLSRQQVAFVEHACGEEMLSLGYSPCSELKGVRVDRAMETVRNKLSWLLDVTILFQYVRHWPAYLFHSALRFLVFRAFTMVLCHSPLRLKSCKWTPPGQHS